MWGMDMPETKKTQEVIIIIFQGTAATFPRAVLLGKLGGTENFPLAQTLGVRCEGLQEPSQLLHLEHKVSGSWVRERLMERGGRRIRAGKGRCPSIDLPNEIFSLKPFCQYLPWSEEEAGCSTSSAVPCPALPLRSARSQRRRQAGHSCQNSSLKERPHHIILPVPVVSAVTLAPLCSPPLSSTALPKMRCPPQVRWVSSHRSDTSPRLPAARFAPHPEFGYIVY